MLAPTVGRGRGRNESSFLAFDLGGATWRLPRPGENPNTEMMIKRLARAAVKQRSAVTSVAVLVLLANLLFAGYVRPPDVLGDDLPMAASCQGGGPGCAEQPLIPPPAVGLPHFDAPPPAVFGALVLVRPAAPAALHPSPPPRLERPPIAFVVA